MSAGEQNRALASLQIGRGLAALFVVLYHAARIFSLDKYWHSYPFGQLFAPGKCGVYYFFVLSGFIIAYAHEKDIGRPNRLGRYVGNRVTRIYPMYWVVTAVTLAGFATLSAGDFRPNFIIGSFMLVPIDGDRGIVAVSWTLFHEMMFYSLFMVLIVSRRWGRVVFAAWFASCVAGIFFVHRWDFLSVVIAPVNMLFFFGFGAFVAVRKYRLPNPRAVGIGGALIFLAVWMFEVAGYGIPQYKIPLTLAYGIAAGLAVWAFSDFELHNRFWCPPVLRLLGNASYSIYLVHFMALSASAKVLIHLRGIIPDTIAFLLMVCLATSIGVAAYLLIERPMTRAIRRIRYPEPA